MARTKEEGYNRPKEDNTVVFPNQKGADGQESAQLGGTGPGIGTRLAGSGGNPTKPRQPEKPIPAANGVGGPWKTLEYVILSSGRSC